MNSTVLLKNERLSVWNNNYHKKTICIPVLDSLLPVINVCWLEGYQHELEGITGDGIDFAETSLFQKRKE